MTTNDLKLILDNLKINYSIRISYIAPHCFDNLLKSFDSHLDLDTFKKEDLSNSFEIFFMYKNKKYNFHGSWFMGIYSITRIN